MSEPPHDWYDQGVGGDVLLTAPPGCGKTEHLARFVAHAIRSPKLQPSQHVLALSYSNRAKTSLQTRIHDRLTLPESRRVTVTNFHGLSYRLYRCHAATAGLNPDALLPQPGWLAALLGRIAKDHGAKPFDLSAWVRKAKAVDCDDDEMLRRLHASGGDAAVAYERELRSELRLDFDDALRYAVRILADERVRHLYRCRFGALVVDECQDLSVVQYQIAEHLGAGRTVFAGDLAQGIYSFAGANAEWVYDQIRARLPREVQLRHSYRSAPPILNVVSAIATELGGERLECATPETWGDRGLVRVDRFPDTATEAQGVLNTALAWVEADPVCSVGVLARTGWRRGALDELVKASEVPCEIWDFPIHRPSIVKLLRRHITKAVARAEDDGGRLQELYLMCHAEIDERDPDHLDELSEAFETLTELITDSPLVDVIARVRITTDHSEAVAPGLHLLTGHIGKGQQFDHVIIVGLEQGQIPYYLATTAEKIREELAVLHVMASRARESLVATIARDVRSDPNREWVRTPSRWVPLIENSTTFYPDEFHRPVELVPEN